MKKIILLFFCSLLSVGYSQDTLVLTNYNDGGKRIQVNSKKDTIIYSYYDAKKLESKQITDPLTRITIYTRYYRNGKTMWEKSIRNNVENGRSSFFNNQGIKVAEFDYKNGFIIDTIYLKTKTYLLFGKASYSSVVYGGMRNEDETSNVQEMEGPYIHLNMKLVNIDPPKKGNSMKEIFFTTDFQGNFFTVVTPGTYGIFPKDYPLSTIYEGQYTSDPQAGKSWSTRWDIKGPLLISTISQINSTSIFHSSVGYAP